LQFIRIIYSHSATLLCTAKFLVHFLCSVLQDPDIVGGKKEINDQ